MRGYYTTGIIFKAINLYFQLHRSYQCLMKKHPFGLTIKAKVEVIIRRNDYFKIKFIISIFAFGAHPRQKIKKCCFQKLLFLFFSCYLLFNIKKKKIERK